MDTFFKISKPEYQYCQYLEPILNSIFENIMIDEFNNFVEYRYYVAYFNDIRLKYKINDLPF
jgi:hypothetical protein